MFVKREERDNLNVFFSPQNTNVIIISLYFISIQVQIRFTSQIKVIRRSVGSHADNTSSIVGDNA